MRPGSGQLPTVESTRREGHDVVVVVSAMGETTDQLVALAAEVSEDPSPRRWTCC